MVLKALMAEVGSNLKLMWVPAHVSIKGNETAAKAVKQALNQEVDNTYKVVKLDWSKWDSSQNRTHLSDLNNDHNDQKHRKKNTTDGKYTRMT
jgi:isoaspartyl peptidase/L-asparaginase-like protein (Ntn-hydrolase superfamily)